MKTLLIMRHAKSDWGNPALADHDRPLNDRGKRDAPRMGRHLKAQGLVPDRVLSSTATRAHRTASEVARAAGHDRDPELHEELYLAPPARCLAILEQLDGDCACVLVVAHNPGLETLVTLLTGRDEVFPTAAVAHVTLDIEAWSEIAPDLGVLRALWRPKEIDPS